MTGCVWWHPRAHVAFSYERVEAIAINEYFQAWPANRDCTTRHWCTTGTILKFAGTLRARSSVSSSEHMLGRHLRATVDALQLQTAYKTAVTIPRANDQAMDLEVLLDVYQNIVLKLNGSR